MSKEVKKNESKELANPIDLNEWGGSPISSQDIILPRILMMQPMSDKVTEGEAAFGEFRESLNNEKLGDFKTPIEVVPFLLQKAFVEYNNEDPTDKKFIRIVPITPTNDNLPYEDTEKTAEGKTIKITRDRCMNFFVLLPKDIDAGTAIPHILSFRRSSIKAGKKLATQMYIKNKDANKPPPAVMANIIATKDSNDKGTFGVMDVNFTKPTPDAYVKECLRWVKLILAGQAKIHEESFNEDVKESVSDVTGPGNF